MKAFQSETVKAFDPENPESFVNGTERDFDFDSVTDAFLGGNYRDGDLDAVNKFLTEEFAMA